MIDGEGMVRLIDFGIAGAAEIEDGQEPLFGSPGHMPPEQLNGGALSPASDVFAVAVLLIEAWTGRAPFRRDTFEESVAALDQPPPDIAESDLELAPLSELISAAISSDPARRPQSAEELARPLREFLRRADTGDIARALGRRVSNCIGEEEAERAPITAPHEPEHPLAAGQTQTFAARDVLLEWTAKIDSHPPRPSRRSLAPAMQGRNAGPPSAPSASRYRVLLTAAAIVAAALGGVQLLTRAFDAGSAERDARRSSPSALQSEPTTRAVSLSAEPAPPAPVAAPPSNLQAPAPERAGVPPAAAPPSSPPNASVAAARVDFTAEPPAIVKLDGTSLGRTPRFAVTVSEGSHHVVFASELLGEQIQTTLRIGAGRERKRVHADFTSAAPRVHVR
jgi:serine/threonine-protein kinase